MKNEFLIRIKEIIEDNISNEQFGVSDLASKIGMSRSNLLRKVKKITGVSASRFISQVRLERAMEMLKSEDFTVSEVGFKVGFNSTSYFIKCFREHYGYPPGELGKRMEKEDKVKEHIPHKHQLSAIMFTDIEGYTQLMQQDESKAVEIRNRHREIFKAVTEKHKGKILQYYGDGTLSTFNSAIDAVRCGIDLQLAFRHDAKIPVRIGVHTGDIIFSEDDIIGDGVNVAARIESLAIEGSVYISGKVHDEIKNQKGIHTIRVGKFDLKNVDKAVEVFAISNSGLAVPGRKIRWIRASIVVAMLAGLVYLLFATNIFNVLEHNIYRTDVEVSRKSIAVLPFINDSDDSSNIYFINGLMESILNDLQKIEGLRVISRTSVEKYRNHNKTIPEIAEELDVMYIVEGSGQRQEGQIFLHVQLINAENDEHLLSEQYIREARDIFTLQLEVAKNIAERVEVIITPEEEMRLEKVYTDNVEAWDIFLRGLDQFNQGTLEGLESGIRFMHQAIGLDPEFARAYAGIAIAYYYMDFLLAEKIYTDSLRHYSDQAMLFDPQLAQSLMVKGMYYINIGQRELAIPYLEKALEINPNYATVLNLLSEHYATHAPDTEKYLEYALKGIGLDIASTDSNTASMTYLHISNAFIQSGFVAEAEKYIGSSLQYDPGNIYSMYVQDFVEYARDQDLEVLNEGLLETFRKDTTRMDVAQEVGKSYYYMGNYKASYAYYMPFCEVRKLYNFNMYNSENAKIALVYDKMGHKEEADSLFEIYRQYAEADPSIYSNVNLSFYYAYKGDTDKALELLELFSKEENYHYWTVLFVDIDPLFESIQDHPEFKRIMKMIKAKFWDHHKQVRTSLEQNGLI